MHYWLESMLKFLTHNILVHIYSSPTFLMETGVNLLMVAIYCLLIIEINNEIRKLNVPPLKIRTKSVSEVNSRRSIYKGVVRNHPDLGVDVVFKDNNSLLKDEWNTSARINKILSTSLSEYIRCDLKKNRSKAPIEGGDDESSLTNIYDNLLKDPDVKKHLNTDGIKRVGKTEILRLL